VATRGGVGGGRDKGISILKYACCLRGEGGGCAVWKGGGGRGGSRGTSFGILFIFGKNVQACQSSFAEVFSCIFFFLKMVPLETFCPLSIFENIVLFSSLSKLSDALFGAVLSCVVDVAVCCRCYYC